MEHSGQYAVNLTKIFQYELRNDLIPAVESKYATYAEGDISIESLVVSRDHRAFAGLSMGSMTTWSSALCGNLDLFSWFGPYSAEGDTQAVLDTVNDPANDIYPIHYIYNANGTADGAYIRHKQMYLQLLEDDYFVEGENIEFTTLQLYIQDNQIEPKNSEGFYLAGIYRIEAGKPVFTILTSAAAEGISFIHERMPVILPQGAAKDWLNPRYHGNDILRTAVTEMEYKAC